MDSDPHPLEFPGSQVVIDALPLGEIGGQHAPLDPTFGHIKDGIEYCPHTQGARASTAFGGGDQIFDPLPFLIGQVAWIYFFAHIPILHNPQRLFRQAHSAASRSVVQAQDHGPSAAVPAGVARGSHWGSSLLTCGRSHDPSSQTRCWGPMVGVSRVRRRVAWFMLSLPTSAPSPGAAVVHTTNGCARAEKHGAWALGGEPTPGGGALRARVRTSSGA